MSQRASDPRNDWADRANRALRDHSHGLENLRSYLEGVGTPSFDRSTEDYMWLLQAIEPKGLSRKLLTSLAVRLLDLDFGPSQPPLRPHYVHNLLSLCAGLEAADALAGPLARVYRQRLVPEADTPNSEYRSVPLVADLCTALIANQKDNSLTGDWIDLLTLWPRPHYLAETPMAGFDGVLGIPGPPRPALVALALREMSRFLDESRERADQFRELLKRVRARYKGRDLELESPNFHYDWKLWAIKLIRPKSGVSVEKGREDGVKVRGSSLVVTLGPVLSRSDLAVASVRNAANDAIFHCRNSEIGLDHCKKFVDAQIITAILVVGGLAQRNKRRVIPLRRRRPA